MFTAGDAFLVRIALLAVEMNTPGRCGETLSVLDAASPTICAAAETIYEDDFESGPNGWSVAHSGPFGPPTPYDWVQTQDPLPFDRPGAAWYCEDRDIGDCNMQDESARHSLFSPPIDLPDEAAFPFLSFTHYMESEAGWDGGNLRRFARESC